MNKAIFYAIGAHTGQKRNQFNIPFVVHPIAVYKTLISLGIRDKDTLNAALLHDTIEDTAITYADIFSDFGIKVADLVNELTSDESRYKVHTSKGYFMDTKKKTVYLIGKMNGMTVTALIIKLADRLDHVIDIANTGSKKWVHKYYIETWAHKYYIETKAILEKIDIRDNKHVQTLMLKIYNILNYYEKEMK